ncbi:MAG: class I SAM-dependent methyltransferase [Acidimicrobiales bacterium]
MSWAYSTLVAEVYDFHLPIGFSNGDVEYYARHLAGVRRTILEPATGTGRVLIPLLEAGFRVEGLDHSPEMLAICRQHCLERGLEPVLRIGDMESFVQPEAYEAVIIPAGSIRNLDGRNAVLRALSCFHESLVPGGRLIVDVAAPRPVTEPGPLRYWRRDAYLWTQQPVHVRFDPLANRTTMLIRYEKWADGELLTTELHSFCLQYWGRDAFEALLAEAGFAVTAVTADYQDDNEPGPDSLDWTFHATRSSGGTRG